MYIRSQLSTAMMQAGARLLIVAFRSVSRCQGAVRLTHVGLHARAYRACGVCGRGVCVTVCIRNQGCRACVSQRAEPWEVEEGLALDAIWRQNLF